METFLAGGWGQGVVAGAGGRATAQKINLLNTYPIWASYGLLNPTGPQTINILTFCFYD